MQIEFSGSTTFGSLLWRSRDRSRSRLGHPVTLQRKGASKGNSFSRARKTVVFERRLRALRRLGGNLLSKGTRAAVGLEHLQEGVGHQ